MIPFPTHPRPGLESPRAPLFLVRRDFLRIGGGLAVAGFVSPTVAARAPAGDRPQESGARSCVLIYLLGGPPHLDM